MTENPTGAENPTGGTPAGGQPASDQYVQSLARGLAVIRAFDADNPVMTLSEVARRTGLTRATARRFLYTLLELGYVRTDGRTFELTALILQLGYSYLSGQSLPQLAQPVLEDLSHELQESTSVSILDGADIVYVARVSFRRIMTVGISVGSRFPAYATSMGRVLLAGLPEDRLEQYLRTAEFEQLTPHTKAAAPELTDELRRVREQGWSLVDQELELGLRSLAVPVRGANGAVTAALNVSMQATLNREAAAVDEAVAAALPALQNAAHKISTALAATAR